MNINSSRPWFAMPMTLILSGFFFMFLQWSRLFSMGLLSFFSFPGTLAHEALHASVGFVLGAHPVGFQLLPQWTPGSTTVVLGSVSFTHLSFWNAAPTGMAPLLLYVFAFPLARWAAFSLSRGRFFLWMALCYCLANFLFAGLPSFQDFYLSAYSLLFYFPLGVTLYFMYRKITSSKTSSDPHSGR